MINFVSQMSNRFKVFVEDLLPTETPTEIQVPTWILWVNGQPVPMPAVTLPKNEGGELWITENDGTDNYTWREPVSGVYADLPGPFSPQGPIMPRVLWVEGGDVWVLRHIEE